MSENEFELLLKSLDLLGYLLSAILGATITWLVTKKDREQAIELAKEERQDKLRLYLLDNRLDAYQQAYKFCQDLITHFNDRAVLDELTITCQQWWDGNCLYLEQPVRDNIFKAFHDCRDIVYREAGLTQQEENAKRKRAWDKVWKAKKSIEEQTGLPETEKTEFSSK